MFKPLSLYIGLRYTRAKRRNHFISFISLASILGIALGVTVLITVLSVMNGFDEQIRERVFSSTPHVQVYPAEGEGIHNWRELKQQITQTDQVTGAAPIVSTEAMLSRGGLVQGGMINGIMPYENRNIARFGEHMVAGRLSDLKPGKFGIVLGEELAQNLQAWVGDKVMVLTPKVNVSPLGANPRYRMFTVVGVFNINDGLGSDSRLAFISMKDAQALLQLGQSVSQINAKVSDFYQAPSVAQKLEQTLGGSYWVSDWTRSLGALFQAISMEKTMMFVILLLLVAIAAFNLVSTLVMVVTDKSSEIAILRTLGAKPGTVMAIFMVQGLTIGLFGTLLGVIGGILLALNVTTVVSGLESLLGVKFISAQVYFVDYLPSQLQVNDVLWIAGAAVVLSFLATLYPAWRAAKTNPAEALRYE